MSFFVAFAGNGSAAMADDQHAQEVQEVTYLAQGWTPDERQQFYFTTQGSHLIPYHWFLHLEQADRAELFRNANHLARLNFLLEPARSPRNPDGLPIGFVLDDNPATVPTDEDYRIKQAYLGPRFPREHFPRTNAWLGLTCAACHTSELEYKGQTFRIDGGPAMADVEQFLIRLADAVNATWQNEEKLARFADQLLVDAGQTNEEQRTLEQAVLRKELEAYARVLTQLVRRSRGTTPYGFGRLDAFGAILNEICETALELPENHHPSDAPASYPFLWDTSQLDWVQWNGSAGSPIARNVGQVLGVFGQLRLDPNPAGDQFRSTVRLDNLDRLEQLVATLRAPVWPEAFGKLDATRVAQGRLLFAENCQQCHGVRDEESGRFPERQIGTHTFIRTTMVPVDRIGTDAKLADNFLARLAKPGLLAPQLPPPFTDQQQVPRPVLLALAVEGVIQRNARVWNLDTDQIAALRAHRPADERPPEVWAYKARPLNGIWATGPYLHNGSVPTLYDLLLPDYERPTTFHVGSRRFDPRRVGLQCSPEPGTFVFRVFDPSGSEIPGNSNRGHSGRNYTHRRQANGTLREFTEDERWALIEYLKSLR